MNSQTRGDEVYTTFRGKMSLQITTKTFQTLWEVFSFFLKLIYVLCQCKKHQCSCCSVCSQNNAYVFFSSLCRQVAIFFVPLAMSAEMYSGHKYLNNGFLHSVFGAGFGIIGKLQMQIFRVAMGELVGRILNLELPLRCIHQHLCV